MTRKRVRPKYSDTELQIIYNTPHAHSGWWDHRYRIAVSTALCFNVVVDNNLTSAADLSAGDAAIINQLPVDNKYVGDFAVRYEYSGPIESNIDAIPDVDLFICSETLEHLDDPDTVLNKIGEKAEWIFVSTPLDEVGDNPEHYWSWGWEDIEDMLATAGYDSVVYTSLLFPGLSNYGYQIHVGKRK